MRSSDRRRADNIRTWSVALRLPVFEKAWEEGSVRERLPGLLAAGLSDWKNDQWTHICIPSKSEPDLSSHHE
jgi:hypothetical protein